MGQYMVRHQTDKTCADCGHYDYYDRQDSFGPVRDEFCNKGHYGRVGYYVSPCKDFKFECSESLSEGAENLFECSESLVEDTEGIKED